MKTLFVNAIKMSSDYPDYSIGQMILKKILEETQDVELIDFDLMSYRGSFQYGTNLRYSISNMGEYLISKKPSLISFYTMCNMFHIVVELTEYIKSRQKNITIIWAGPQATLLADECMNSFSGVDIISRGEGERNIIPLIRALEEGQSLSKIQGISYRISGNIIHNEDAPLVPAVELHQYTVYDYAPYSIQERGYVELEGGRGCPFECTFCATKTFWQQKFRIKPIEHLVKEMDTFYEMYQIRDFVIIHDMFTANHNHLLEFCEAVRGKKYRWSCSSRLDVLNEKMIDYMYQSGCVSIYIGIETGSQRMQKIINKKLQLACSLDKIKMICRKGINVTLSFMYGFPEENEQDIRDTLMFIQQLLKCGIFQIQLHQFIPLPKTAETEKVMDCLYWDLEQTDDSVVLPQYLDEACVAKIREHPDIFSSYYTFDTPVKEKYRYLDALAVLFHRSTLPEVQKLFQRENLTDFYIRNRQLFKKIHNDLPIRRRSELRKDCMHVLRTEIRSEKR